jgi:hypothetical protein
MVSEMAAPMLFQASCKRALRWQFRITPEGQVRELLGILAARARFERFVSRFAELTSEDASEEAMLEAAE